MKVLVTGAAGFIGMQDGGAVATYAETVALQADTGFAPSTSITEGIGCFVDWYRSYYRDQ